MEDTVGSLAVRCPAGGDLLASIRDVVRQSRKAVAYGVNTAMVLTNYEIGRLIIEHEQKGTARTEYARQTLKTISSRLTTEFGKGYSVDNLELMRQFYVTYGARMGAGRSLAPAISQRPSARSTVPAANRKSEKPSRISFPSPSVGRTMSS